MILHADSVAQNRPTGVRASGIDRDDPDRTVFFAIVLGQLINQRALASAGRTSEAQNPRMPRLRKQGLQQIRPTGRPVFDDANRPRQTSRIAGAELLDQRLEVEAQSVSVKHMMEKEEIAVLPWTWQQSPKAHGCAVVIP